MRSSLPVLGLLSFGIASPALAQWDALGRVFGMSLTEISIPLSAASSQASSEASSQASTSSSRSASRAECEADRDCHSDYQCRQRQCIARVVALAPPPKPAEAAPPGPACAEGTGCGGEPADGAARCGEDADCGPGLQCQYSYCTQLQPPPAVSAPKCASQADCGEGRGCAGGQCVADPPMPSSSLRRRASELYLRAQVVELREELALGRGPVITALAQAQQLPADQVGRALRAHRAELAALIGDASGADWSARFLSRVEQLCPRA